MLSTFWTRPTAVYCTYIYLFVYIREALTRWLSQDECWVFMTYYGQEVLKYRVSNHIINFGGKSATRYIKFPLNILLNESRILFGCLWNPRLGFRAWNADYIQLNSCLISDLGFFLNSNRQGNKKNCFVFGDAKLHGPQFGNRFRGFHDIALPKGMKETAFLQTWTRS